MRAKLSLSFIILFSLIVCPNLLLGQTDKSSTNRSYLIKVQISEADKVKVFENTWQTVNRLYFDPTFNGMNWSKLREVYLPQAVAAKDKMELLEVLNKMLGELKTSHLGVSFVIGLNGKTLKDFFGEKVNYKQNDITFDYGFSTAKFGEQTVVTDVEKNSSADAVGIKVGWIMKSLKAKTTTKKENDSATYAETADCIFSTENGQETNLSLSKSFYLKPRSATKRISKVLADDILYLRFDSFDKDTGKWMKKTIADNIPSPNAIIIDMRGNTGGLVDEVKETLSSFFAPNTIVGSFIERDLDEKLFRVGSKDFYKGKVLVLIDGKSTSGAEIFASAFQEAERGKIIGQKSAGKVLYAITKGLSNDLKLYIAIRDYKTSKGVRLEGKGVTPDVEVPFTIEDFRGQHDSTLEKALELLRIGQ